MCSEQRTCEENSCQHLLSVQGWKDVLAAVSPGRFPMHNSQTVRECYLGLDQCLNTSKWNKDPCQHNNNNNKKIVSSISCLALTSKMPGRCGMSSNQNQSIFLWLLWLFHLLEEDQNTRGAGGRLRDVSKLHWSEALKYEKGNKTAQAWGLCFCLGEKKQERKKPNTKKRHPKHNHDLN